MRATRSGLVLLLLAAAITVGDWIPAPSAHAVPETVAREVRIDADAVRGGSPGMQTAGENGMHASRAATTEPAVVCAPIRFTSVALAWDQSEGRSPHVRIQAGNDRSRFRREMEVQADHGPDPGTGEAAGTVRATDPLWVHDARCVRFVMELPAGATISNLRAVFVNTSGTSGEPTEWNESSAPAEGADVAAATAWAPAYVTRAGWGADESLKNCGPNYADELKMAFVHHTATENGYPQSEADDIVRSIYYYHAQTLGWCDIAYNFLVDRFGKVYVGRAGGPAQNVIGAAQQGFNTGAVSVAAIGEYGATTPPSAMLTGIKRTLAWKLDLNHVPPNGWAWMVSSGGPNTKYPAGKGVTLRVISAHRDTGYTSCPGDRLYAQMGSIREGTHAIGLPKMFRTKQTTDTITPGLDTVHYTAFGDSSLSWTVTIAEATTGIPVRTLRQTGVNLDVSWNGMQGGLPARSGTYTATISATNATGGVARPATFTLRVE